jgi:flagellin
MPLNTVTLTSAMRSNLFSLQQTSQAMRTTQERLATGKRVNTAVDDPIAFFTAREHTQRADDLEGRKDQMSEAIQTIQAANDGVETITSLIASARSLAQSALSSESQSERATLCAMFNDTLAQIDTVTDDSGYSGVNLLKSDSQKLDVKFDEGGDSKLTVTGFDATHSGLEINKAFVGTATGQAGFQSDVQHNGNPTNWVGTVDFNQPYDKNDITGESSTNNSHDNSLNYSIDVTGMDSLDVWYNFNTREPISTWDRFEIDINGNNELTVQSGDYGDSDPSTVESSGWKHFTYDLTDYSDSTLDLTIYCGNTDDTLWQSWAYVDIDSTGAGINNWTNSSGIETSIDELNSAQSDLRTHSKELSSGLNIITTRQDFTTAMVNILSDGAANLTNADMNEEGANMLMLQTRQMLGATSLAMASQASQSVLRLF